MCINKASLPLNLDQLLHAIFSDLMDRAILQASDRSRKKSQIFGATFAEKQSVKKWPISWEFTAKLSLETNRFYADLMRVFSVF